MIVRAVADITNPFFAEIILAIENQTWKTLCRPPLRTVAMTMAKIKLGWGLIGASDIAKTRMIEAINGQRGSAVVAVMSTSEERRY